MVAGDRGAICALTVYIIVGRGHGSPARTRLFPESTLTHKRAAELDERLAKHVPYSSTACNKD